MKMKLKLIAADYHRNGCTGAPFIASIFTDDDGSKKVGVDFGGDRFAVLQIDLLTNGNILFAQGNSWRGDHYASEVRQLYPQNCLEALNEISTPESV